MAADDLSKPLTGVRGAAARPRLKRAVMLAGGSLVLAAVVLGGVFLLRGDDTGGEPVAVLALNGPEGTPAGAGGSMAGGALAMRNSVDPGDEEPDQYAARGDQANDGGVRITMPDGTVLDDANGGDAPAGIAVAGAREAAPAAASDNIVLAAAPDPALVERAKVGMLPRIAGDGRKPAQVYARPAPVMTAPGGNTPARIAIMVTALGISASGTDQAIKALPGEISLAFAPYGRDLQHWVDRARQDGHEVLLQLPMEPFDYPDNDPGPHTMLAGGAPAENLRKLHWLMAQMSGYFAVTNYMGARFSSTPQALTPILEEIGNRGVAFVDDGSSPRSEAGSIADSLGLQTGHADVIIDAGQTKQRIDAALKRLEAIARERGFAIGTGTALPGTIESIAAWSRDLQSRGIELVPVSAVVSRAQRS